VFIAIASGGGAEIPVKCTSREAMNTLKYKQPLTLATYVHRISREYISPHSCYEACSQ